MSVDITPSNAHYRRMLVTIINHTENEEDREWAKAELKRHLDVEAKV